MHLPTYHSHTNYCDGEGSPEDYIRKALDLGLFAYGFSSHGPVPFPNDWSMNERDVEDYLADIRMLKSSYRQLIEIYAGLEADYIPGKCSPKQVREQYRLDYVIGSVHYVKQFNSGVPWQIDGSPEVFERGYNEIFNRNPRSFISDYYQLLRKMVQEETPDIVGHLDKIKMHNQAFRLYEETDNWYRQEVLETLATIRDLGCIMEVNTRGMYKKNLPDPYPGEWVIREARKLNIPVVISSDAHHPSEINLCYREMIDLLQNAGYNELMILRNNEWQEVAVSIES